MRGYNLVSYLSVQTKNKYIFFDGVRRNSSIFASLDSWSKAAWKGKTFANVSLRSERFNAFSTFLHVSICILRTKQLLRVRLREKV